MPALPESTGDCVATVPAASADYGRDARDCVQVAQRKPAPELPGLYREDDREFKKDEAVLEGARHLFRLTGKWLTNG
jgi:hypothetical protein